MSRFSDDLIFNTDSTPADLPSLYPDTREDCYLLLNTFIANVDPMIRLIHRPSLTRKFDMFVETRYPLGVGSSSTVRNEMDSFEPLVMSIFLAAVNSMKEQDVSNIFATEKSQLLARFRKGTEIYLRRQQFLTSRAIEVLQAFVILLARSSLEM